MQHLGGQQPGGTGGGMHHALGRIAQAVGAPVGAEHDLLHQGLEVAVGRHVCRLNPVQMRRLGLVRLGLGGGGIRAGGIEGLLTRHAGVQQPHDGGIEAGILHNAGTQPLQRFLAGRGRERRAVEAGLEHVGVPGAGTREIARQVPVLERGGHWVEQAVAFHAVGILQRGRRAADVHRRAVGACPVQRQDVHVQKQVIHHPRPGAVAIGGAGGVAVEKHQRAEDAGVGRAGQLQRAELGGVPLVREHAGVHAIALRGIAVEHHIVGREDLGHRLVVAHHVIDQLQRFAGHAVVGGVAQRHIIVGAVAHARVVPARIGEAAHQLDGGLAAVGRQIPIGQQPVVEDFREPVVERRFRHHAIEHCAQAGLALGGHQRLFAGGWQAADQLQAGGAQCGFQGQHLDRGQHLAVAGG